MVAWLAVRLVKPFRALRYDEEQAGRLDDLVAPPHDVISPELHAQLLAASPYNSVRLIHPTTRQMRPRHSGSGRTRGC